MPENPRPSSEQPKNPKSGMTRRDMLAATGAGLVALKNVFAGTSEQKEKQDTVSAKVTFKNAKAHTRPVELQSNLGSKDEALPAKSAKLEPSKQLDDLSLPVGKTTTVDIAGSTFRVIINGKSSPPQASPYPIMPKPGDTASIEVEDPIDGSAPDLEKPLAVEKADATKTRASINILAPGSYYLPYQIEVFDRDKKSVKVLTSLDGKVPADTDGLPAGDYLVQVRPLKQHYPVTSRLAVQGGDESANGARRANLRRSGNSVVPMLVPVRLKAGQSLTVTVEEGIESYNQKMDHFQGVPVDTVFNTPYLHYNNPSAGQVAKGTKPFMPNENDQFANTSLAYMELGSEKLAAGLAKKVAAGMQEAKSKPAGQITTEYRWNHVTFSHALTADGRLPEAFAKMSQAELEKALTLQLKDTIDWIMQKPHRSSDAMAIHQLAADKDEGFGKSAVPVGTPVHYNKLDAIRDYGNQYRLRAGQNKPKEK